MKENVWLVVVCSLVIGGIVGYFIAPSTKQTTPSTPPAQIVSTEQNKIVARQVFEEVDKGNLAFLDEVAASDYRLYFPAGNPQALDGAGHRKLVEGLRSGFPDVKHTIFDQIAEGDKVTTVGSFTGTHKGEFQGIKPTGKSVTVSFIQVVRFSEGKIVGEWINLDTQGLLQQLTK